MQDHSFTIERSAGRTRIELAPVFNAAVAFIDRHLAEGRAEKVAIRTDDETVTYGALAERVNRCGNALAGLGLGAGGRVLMVVKDCPQFVYAFWGAIKAGLVPVPLNTMLRGPDYAFMIDNSECAVLVVSPEYRDEVDQALAAAAHAPRHVLPAAGGEDALPTLMDAAEATLEAAPAAPGDDCFWLYSSGSTGRPKAAIHAQRAMVVTSQRYGVDTLGVTEADICFSAAKLFFAYGLGNAMTFPLWVGGTAVLSDQRPSPPMTFEAIERHRPSLYFGVPTLYAAQLQALPAARPDLGSLRLCVSAGEALPADILRRWREQTGLTILDGIGSTEALHIFISNRDGDVKPGASGRVVEGYRARVVGEDGDEAAAGESGALWIAGDSTARAYWNDPERTSATMVDGWLNTGDTYVRDRDGYYLYAGRTDDMMKVGGIWCSPFEIEARLVEHEKVLEAAVIGRPDAEQLVKPAAFVVLTDPAAASDELAEELLAHCKDGLAPYKYPRWFHFETDLPKTATGKIQRFKLRQRQ